MDQKEGEEEEITKNKRWNGKTSTHKNLTL
jgi:hypothetical protein